jgi:hypothetical protein
MNRLGILKVFGSLFLAPSANIRPALVAVNGFYFKLVPQRLPIGVPPFYRAYSFVLPNSVLRGTYADLTRGYKYFRKKQQSDALEQSLLLLTPGGTISKELLRGVFLNPAPMPLEEHTRLVPGSE